MICLIERLLLVVKDYFGAEGQIRVGQIWSVLQICPKLDKFGVYSKFVQN